MNTIEKLESLRASLSDHATQKLDEIIADLKGEVTLEVPKKGYAIYNGGDIVTSSSSSFASQAAYHISKESAERYAHRAKMHRLLWHARMQLCPDFEEDWENPAQGQWGPYIKDGVVKAAVYLTIEKLGFVCFDTEEHAIQAGEWAMKMMEEEQ